MKKQLFLIVCLLVSSIQSNAQVSTAFNNVGSWTNEYVGWDNGMGVPLRIKHEANEPIEFYTNTGAGTFGTPKMTLANTGELGLGTTSPSSWFHILTNGSGTVAASEVFRTDVPAMTATNWRIFRAGTEYFQLNVASSGNGVFLHSRRGDFHIASGNSGTPIPSFQIRGGSGGDAGNLGFGDYTTLTSPQALLHLYKSASVDFQMTNSATGNTNVDGFRIIVDTTRAVSLYNWEDKDIFFGTGDVGAGGALTN